jgi:hypothetical protein
MKMATRCSQLLLLRGYSVILINAFHRQFAYLAGALSLLVALTDTVLALHRASQAAAARSTPRVTVITPGTPLASEAVVADPARTLTLMIAMGSRGAQSASTQPAAYLWYEIPRTRSASVAVLAVGQAGTNATTGVEVTHVTGPHARVAHCETDVILSFAFSQSLSGLYDGNKEAWVQMSCIECRRIAGM